MPALQLFLFTILLPLMTIVMLWRRPRLPRVGWIATLFASAGITGFSVLAAPWGVFGLPVRYALVVLFLAALVVSLRRDVPAEQKEESPFRTLVKILVGSMFAMVGFGVIRGRDVPPMPLDLGFPLRGGSFLIGHGGSTGPSNLHHADPRQRYALDIMKLTPYGTRARGLFPADLTRYAIYEAEVLSPCDGAVTAVVSALPDTIDPKNALGNHIVIRCGDADVTLAQLRQGSVGVQVGANVSTGQIIARVGASGISPEPHLHVHAERNGAAVPARFGGEWWVRNEVARR